jgi:putative ubiquitin-RnfH superfamily antitoxin RatB of RatAB toxin-antitoxin module
MRVEVVYAGAAQQHCVSVELAPGANIADAVAAARRTAGYPAFEAGDMQLGIFGKLATPETPLREGDRVEIYRPLLVDPMQARRRRARKKGGKPVRPGPA